MLKQIAAVAKLVSYLIWTALVALQPFYGGQKWFVAAIASAGAVSVYLARSTPPPPQ